VESFNGKLRDALLNAEVFKTLAEAKVLIEPWRVHYNTIRPHSSLEYRPPAPDVSVLEWRCGRVIQIQPAQISRPLPCCTNILHGPPKGAGQNFTEINLTIKLRSTGTGRKWIKGYTIASRPNWRRSSTHGIKVYNQWPSVAVASRKELDRRRALARLRRIVVWIGFVLLIVGHR